LFLNASGFHSDAAFGVKVLIFWICGIWKWLGFRESLGFFKKIQPGETL